MSEFTGTTDQLFYIPDKWVMTTDGDTGDKNNYAYAGRYVAKHYHASEGDETAIHRVAVDYGYKVHCDESRIRGGNELRKPITPDQLSEEARNATIAAGVCALPKLTGFRLLEAMGIDAPEELTPVVDEEWEHDRTTRDPETHAELAVKRGHAKRVGAELLKELGITLKT